MQRIYWGNMAFEQELVAPEAEMPERVARRIAEMAAGWLAVADEGDGVYCPGRYPASFWEQMQAVGLPEVVPFSREEVLRRLDSSELVPWGWSPPMRRLVTSQQSVPTLAAVRAVNARRFAARLEREWGCGLEGSIWIDSLDACADVVRTSFSEATAWVLKADFGQAGRERIRGRGPEIGEQVGQWLSRRLQQGQGAVLEPWVQVVEEVGMQWSISREGDIVWEGGTWLHSTSSGGYGGTTVPDDPAAFARDWAEVLDVQRAALNHVFAAGYFGPVGIDAMRYRDAAGEVRVRPLQDLNARWTMGRLALGFGKRLGCGQGGTWSHGTTPPAGAIVTTPEQVDDKPATASSWWQSS